MLNTDVSKWKRFFINVTVYLLARLASHIFMRSLTRALTKEVINLNWASSARHASLRPFPLCQQRKEADRKSRQTRFVVRFFYYVAQHNDSPSLTSCFAARWFHLLCSLCNFHPVPLLVPSLPVSHCYLRRRAPPSLLPVAVTCRFNRSLLGKFLCLCFEWVSTMRESEAVKRKMKNIKEKAFVHNWILTIGSSYTAQSFTERI